jgi:hypothetical protein
MALFGDEFDLDTFLWHWGRHGNQMLARSCTLSTENWKYAPLIRNRESVGGEFRQPAIRLP